MTPFHAGEIEVQQRAGVRAMGERVGRSIGGDIPLRAQQFLSEQTFVVVAGADGAGEVWATLLAGAPNFAHALDETTLQIGAAPASGDPLERAWETEAPMGLLAIEPATRRRMRLNGTALARDARLEVRAQQVYANCPKYIGQRELQSSSSGNARARARAARMTPEQSAFIARADTFFIASLAPGFGADASHRGGNAGFVRVESATRLAFPDYAGNAMFNTLGNLQLDARAGLLFADWQSGATLQLSGRASINWDAARAAQFAGAERVVEFEIANVIAIEGAIQWQWKWLEASPFNPV